MIVIDFYFLVLWLLPPQHKAPEVIEYLNAAFKPLIQLHETFDDFYAQIKYELEFNGQVCNLERLMNETFDPINNGIYITDAVFIEQVFIFNDAENNEETYLFNNSEGGAPTYLFNQSEINPYDFIVNVPSTVAFNEVEMKYLLNKYKHAAKRYKIEII